MLVLVLVLVLTKSSLTQAYPPARLNPVAYTLVKPPASPPPSPPHRIPQAVKTTPPSLDCPSIHHRHSISAGANSTLNLQAPSTWPNHYPGRPSPLTLMRLTCLQLTLITSCPS